MEVPFQVPWEKPLKMVTGSLRPMSTFSTLSPAPGCMLFRGCNKTFTWGPSWLFMTRKVPAVLGLIINEVLRPCLGHIPAQFTALLSSEMPTVGCAIFLCFTSCHLLMGQWLSSCFVLWDAARGSCGRPWPTLFHELWQSTNRHTLPLGVLWWPCSHLMETSPQTCCDSCHHEFRIFPPSTSLTIADWELLLTCPGWPSYAQMHLHTC